MKLVHITTVFGGSSNINHIDGKKYTENIYMSVNAHTDDADITYTNENTILFTVGRMNPPTPGHLHLIRQLIEEGIQKNIQRVYVILSKTHNLDDNAIENTNPIKCEEKVALLCANNDVLDSMVSRLKTTMIAETTDLSAREKIRNMNVVCLCVPPTGASPFSVIGQLIHDRVDTPELHLFLLIGEDRATMIDSVRKVFTKITPENDDNKNVKSVRGKSLARPNMEKYKAVTPDTKQTLDLTTSEIPVGAISASYVRNLVASESFDAFKTIYSPYLPDDKIQKLYHSISRGLSYPVTKSAKKRSRRTTTSSSKKRYVQEGGKRKTRTRSRK